MHTVEKNVSTEGHGRGGAHKIEVDGERKQLLNGCRLVFFDHFQSHVHLLLKANVFSLR